MNYYPGNTLTKYITKLHSSMALDGDWEVGLAEITFPRTWYTVDKRGAQFTVEKTNPLHALTTANSSDVREFRINSGYYDSVQDLLKEMNNAVGKQQRATSNTMQKKDDEFKFRYNEVNRKVLIGMQAHELLTLSSTLATILGVTGTGIDNLSPTPYLYKGDKVCDINRGVTAIYVYCDILEYVPVGDTKAPLLRIVPADGQNGESIYRTFDEPRYIPLQKKHFDSIEVDIRDDFGEAIAFETGKLAVTLHFRQAQRQYLF
jgi:hypothetical protein